MCSTGEERPKWRAPSDPTGGISRVPLNRTGGTGSDVLDAGTGSDTVSGHLNPALTETKARLESALTK